MTALGRRPLFTRLDRYLASTVITGGLAGLLVIVCLSFVFEFIDKADAIGAGDYGFAEALLAVALSMVQRAYEAFPMATLVGALATLGGLAARSELTVMRAAGLSVARIARPVLVAGVLLALLAAAIGEWVAPPATRLAQAVQAEASSDALGSAGDGLWARDGDWLLRIERVPATERLAGVSAYQLSAHRLERIVTAPAARFIDGAWQLEAARVTHFQPGRVRVKPSASVRLGGELRPAMLDVVVVDAGSLAAGELWRYIGYLQANDLDADRYRLAFWVKVATPLATVVMLLLTVPLVFAAKRHTAVGHRVFLGVLVGLAFFLLNRFLGNAGLIYGLPAPVSALAPTVLFGLIALAALRRVR